MIQKQSCANIKFSTLVAKLETKGQWTTSIWSWFEMQYFIRS